MKELRHYSATQLLTAGTDLNTVAGRLGHCRFEHADLIRLSLAVPAGSRLCPVSCEEVARC